MPHLGKTLLSALAIAIAGCAHQKGCIRTAGLLEQWEFQRSQAAQLKEALKACREIPGYNELSGRFIIEYAHLGCINSMPESLFVELKAKASVVVDSVRWWNPLVGKKPSFTWTDFLSAHQRAEQAVGNYPWLAEWKMLPGKRSLELQLLGTAVGKDKEELKTYFMPVWRHAAMKGKPTVNLLARFGFHSWFDVVFSNSESRALIASTSSTNDEPRCELERLKVHWHPRGTKGTEYSRYAVVSRKGVIGVRTFAADSR